MDEYEPQLTFNRSRSNSEPTNLEYSQIREVMSGTSLNTQDVPKIEAPSVNIPSSTMLLTPSVKNQQYESLSSAIKRYNRDAVLRSESIDEWAEGHRITFRFLSFIQYYILITIVNEDQTLVAFMEMLEDINTLKSIVENSILNICKGLQG